MCKFNMQNNCPKLRMFTFTVHMGYTKNIR